MMKRFLTGSYSYIDTKQYQMNIASHLQVSTKKQSNKTEDCNCIVGTTFRLNARKCKYVTRSLMSSTEIYSALKNSIRYTNIRLKPNDDIVT
jgi:IS1 family transposase